MLQPFYAMARLFPPTRDGANRLALVTLEQMTQTLAWAVEILRSSCRFLSRRRSSWEDESLQVAAGGSVCLGSDSRLRPANLHKRPIR